MRLASIVGKHEVSAGKIILCCLVTLIISSNCGKKYTRLDVVIGEQPVGGANVEMVSAIVVGRLLDGEEPITATFQWYWDSLPQGSGTVVFEHNHTYREQEHEEFTTGVQAPSGYVLLGYFWLYVTWTDEDETENEVFSDTAYCYTTLSAVPAKGLIGLFHKD